MSFARRGVSVLPQVVLLCKYLTHFNGITILLWNFILGMEEHWFCLASLSVRNLLNLSVILPISFHVENETKLMLLIYPHSKMPERAEGVASISECAIGIGCDSVLPLRFCPSLDPHGAW